MNNHLPHVSVLMAAYNVEKYIGEAIDSILSQTFTDFEFIILNDGSKDNTKEIIQSYRDTRIQFIDLVTNSGLSNALNKGLEVARGEYIARMDADDISLPTRLTTQVNYLDSHNDVGVLGTAYYIFDQNGNQNSVMLPATWSLLRWTLPFASPIAHATVMFKKSLLSQTYNYDPRMMHAEDYDLWVRLSYITKMQNLPQIEYRVRKHGGNVSSVYAMEQLKNSINISRQEIIRALGREVPVQYVERLWVGNYANSKELGEVTKLINELLRVYTSKNALCENDKTAIRRDAAKRLFLLARAQAQLPASRLTLFHALWLDPSLLTLVGAGLRRRINTLR